MKNSIALVIPTMTSGGAERVMSILANEWTKLGKKVHLIVWNNESKFYELDDRIIQYDLEFKYISRKDRFLKQFTTLYRLHKILKRIQPDFVLSFLPLNNILTLIASFGLKSKIIISERNNPYFIDAEISRFNQYMRKFLYQYRASGLIIQTKTAEKVLKKEFPSLNIKSISNPINVPQVNREVSDEIIILNIGRLHEQKGQKDLLKAASSLLSINWKLVFLGNGHLKKELVELAIQLNILEKVHFVGAVRNIESWLSKATIFVFPSYYEGFPNALAEAMCAGVPVISYNCNTGPSELIIDGINGFLIDVGNSNELAEKIDILIKDKQLQAKFSLEGKKIKSKVEIEIVSKKYLDFCLEITTKEKK